MKNRERVVYVVLLLLLLAVVLSSGKRPSIGVGATTRAQPQPGVRLSMGALHQQGGVPIGWQMSPPPGDAAAGRQAFVEAGCPSCHRVDGAASSGTTTPSTGPDLSGMGDHHPAAYFVEAILNPDAVLIDGPGYIGADGHSTMPTYPEMTAAQLSDIVAYLVSLKQPGTASCHAAGSSMSATVMMSNLNLRGEPRPPTDEARSFFTQTYAVLPGQLAAFEAWFANEGRQQFLAADGLLSIDTFVDATRPGNRVISRFGFRNEAALRNFMGDPATVELWKRFDSFVGPHGHLSSAEPPVYRAESLSAAAPQHTPAP